MKLIIDVSDDTYKKIIADKYAIYDRMYYSIKNGIPLNKIRAEIEALPKTYPFINHIDTYVKEDDVKKIIDRYMKGE